MLMMMIGMVKGSRSSSRRNTAFIVVVIEALIFEDLKTEVTNSDHSFLAKTRGRYDIGRTTGAEYLATNAAVMLPSPSSEHTLAVVAFLAMFIVHPVIPGKALTTQTSNNFTHRSSSLGTCDSSHTPRIIWNRETWNRSAIHSLHRIVRLRLNIRPLRNISRLFDCNGRKRYKRWSRI